jgi:2-polyprenyl-3-methyl-5-hydroxy-6-metoxy-1,4-benzoquinol methylase
MRYPPVYDEQGSTGRAVALLRDASCGPGVVLDLGCGTGAVAEPLRALGLDYVGCDVDAEALAHLADRGFETHELSLAQDEEALVGRLRAIVGDRPLAAVLALDVLEHLVAPDVVLRAVHGASPDPEASAPLVVSIPNVAHFDVAAKLLLGRWDLDDGGLLDDTHVRFFSESELARLLVAGGWQAEAAADTVAEVSDQCWPVDAPTLRPGAPLRELLRDVRTDAGPGATTYQFVRLLRPSPTGPEPAAYTLAADEQRPLVTAVVVGDEEAPPLLADLAAQEPPVTAVVRATGAAALSAALAEVATRFVVVFDARARVAPGWTAAVAEGLEAAPGRVLQLAATAVDDERLGAGGDWASVVADAAPLDIEGFDPLHLAPPRPVVVAAFVVPSELVVAAGVRPAGDDVADGLAVWLARAVQLSGSLPVGTEPLVAVPNDVVAGAASADARVLEALDRRAMVLPAGSAGRLAAARRRLLDAETAVPNLRHLLKVEQEKVAHLSFHLRHFGDELDDLRPELERLRREHARRPSRRLAALVRRLLG